MKRTVVLYLRVDEDLKDALVEKAFLEDRTLSSMASMILRKALKVDRQAPIQ